jgi:hypothetical protein
MTDNNLFALNKEIGYNNELMVNSVRKNLKVGRKLQAAHLLIDVRKEIIGEMSQDEKRMLDFEDERSSVEVPKISDEEKNEISSGNDSDCESEEADGGFAVAGMESSKDLQIMLNQWQSHNTSPQGSQASPRRRQYRPL